MWLLPRVRDFVAAHACTLAGSWCCPAEPAHFCHHSEIESIRWQMDWHYPLFPAHRHQCAYHSAGYAPMLADLCDATWILTRQCEYSVSSGRCPKHDDVLPTDGGANDTRKISLWHRAGLRKWYPTAGRCQVMVHIDRRHPVRRISWALNLGLDRKLLICINLCGYRSHWGSGNSLAMAKRPLIRGSSLPLQGLANGTL